MASTVYATIATPGPAGPTGPTGPQGPPGVAYSPKGAWSSSTTYAQGDEVSFSSALYISLQAGNLNHSPSTNPTWWQPVGSGAQQTPWLTNIDGGNFQLGNVAKIGIAKTTPSYALDVVGDCNITGNYRVGGAILISFSSGNIGIGNTTPTFQLDVLSGTLGGTSGNSLNVARFQYLSGNADALQITAMRNANGTTFATATTRLQKEIDATLSAYIDFNPGGGSVGSLAFGNSQATPQEQVRIDATTGRVGIGVTAPGFKLDINGDCNLASGSVYRINGTPISSGIGTSSGDIHASRSLGTVYPTSGAAPKAMYVQVVAAAPSGGGVLQAFSDTSSSSPTAQVANNYQPTNAASVTIGFWVMAGSYYKVTAAAGMTVVNWIEYT